MSRAAEAEATAQADIGTDIWAIVPAAGLSSRMEGFKPLLPLDGMTALARVTAMIRQAGVERILTVTGHRDNEVAVEADRLGILTAHNDDFTQGMFSSVRTGVRALPDSARAFLTLPVDIPLVRPWTVRLLLQARERHPDRVLHPVFDGRRGHPPLIPTSLRPDILAWDGPGGLAGLLHSLPHTGHDVDVADGGILFDMDRDEDYALARARVARLDIPNQNECHALLALTPGLHPRTVSHSRAVAHYALEMARAVSAKGERLNMPLVEAAALLHDIAKGRPHHEREGGELLRRMGLTRTADIVAVHRDIQPPLGPPEGPVTETEIVYLADKVARGTELVSVEERFQAKLDAYAHDPEAVAAIRGRLSRALAVRACVERAAGAPLADLLTQYRGPA